MKTAKISVHCITYNHESFIRQALEGFLMQQVRGKYQIFVADDCSTDGTRKIISEFANRYPDLVFPIFQHDNRGAITNSIDCMRAQTGEYVAMCEGDDYWTDPLKLQKQIDFLDAHPDYSVCFHPAQIIWQEDPGRAAEIFPTPEFRFEKTTLTADDLVQHNFILTNSVVYRWAYHQQESLEAFPEGILPGDWYLHLVHAKHGKIAFLDDVMSVYRRHSGGIWQNHFLLRYGLKHLRFFDEVDKLFDFQYHEQILQNKHSLSIMTLKHSVSVGDYDQLIRMSLEFPPLDCRLFQNIIIPHEQFSFRHRLVNRITKFLGLGGIFVDSSWL